MSNSLYGVVHKMLQPVVLALLYLSVMYWIHHRILTSVVLGVCTLALYSLSQACLANYEQWQTYLRNEKNT